MTQALVWNHVSPGNHPPNGDLELLPEYINLDFLGLFPYKNTKFGLKNSVVYYENWDKSTNTFSNPIARVVWQTVFSEVGNPPNPLYQNKKVSYLLNNGKWSEPKVSVVPILEPKAYWQKRRERIIDELEQRAIDFGLESQIKTLYEAYSAQIYIHTQAGSPKFRDAIISSTEEWLNNPSTDGRTVRDVIVDYLSIGVEVDT